MNSNSLNFKLPNLFTKNPFSFSWGKISIKAKINFPRFYPQVHLPFSLLNRIVAEEEENQPKKSKTAAAKTRFTLVLFSREFAALFTLTSSLLLVTLSPSLYLSFSLPNGS